MIGVNQGQLRYVKVFVISEIVLNEGSVSSKNQTWRSTGI